MPIPARTLLCAVVSAAAVVAMAPAAHAAPMCQTTTGGPFDGTYVCVEADFVDVTGWRKMPYSVGGVCVDTWCPVSPVSGEIDVPVVERTRPIWGQVCVPVGPHGNPTCVPLDLENIDWG